MNHEFPRGLGVALVSCFCGNSGNPAGSLDLDSFTKLVRRVAQGGADYLVVLGSTGEAATITDDERRNLVRAAVRAAGSVPVVVGTGHNATARAVELTRMAAEDGARAALVVCPYYNKPQADGLVAHYEAVASLGLPIIAYNVPGRTGLNMGPSVMTRLWAIPGIIALKESSGNLAQLGELVRTAPFGKVILAGDDALALPSIALGAQGLVSVAANLCTRRVASLVSEALDGNMEKARLEHYSLLPFMDAIFLETNPAPIKAALSMAGFCSDEPRLPLSPAGEATRAALGPLVMELGS